MPQIRYVIIFNARMGSTHLTALLRSHPQIHARGEVLGRARREGLDATAQHDAAYHALEAAPRYRVVGFKTKLRDVLFGLDAFTALLTDRDVRVIHLDRHNAVKHAVSVINARRLAERGVRGGKLTDESDRLPPAAIDPRELREIMETRAEAHRETRKYVEGLDRPLERVAYEDLLADSAGVVARLFRFLGVQPHTASSGVLKNTPDDLRRAVSNFDELRSAFAGTRYEAMFDGGSATTRF